MKQPSFRFDYTKFKFGLHGTNIMKRRWAYWRLRLENTIAEFYSMSIEASSLFLEVLKFLEP